MPKRKTTAEIVAGAIGATVRFTGWCDRREDDPDIVSLRALIERAEELENVGAQKMRVAIAANMDRQARASAEYNHPDESAYRMAAAIVRCEDFDAENWPQEYEEAPHE